MNDKLRETVQNFLVDHDNTSSNFNLTDYMLWLDTATELLQKCVVDDYKIVPQDQKTWNYIRPTIGFDDKGQPIVLDSWDNKTNLPKIEKISVMNLKPDDILVFSTNDKISSSVYSRIDQKITDWKIQNNITNKHLIITSLKLEVLSKAQCKKLEDK